MAMVSFIIPMTIFIPGYWRDGKRHGYGILNEGHGYRYSSGYKYMGQWANGKPHGQGYFNYDGDYMGALKQGKRHGFGINVQSEDIYFEAGGKSKKTVRILAHGRMTKSMGMAR